MLQIKLQMLQGLFGEGLQRQAASFPAARVGELRVPQLPLEWQGTTLQGAAPLAAGAPALSLSFAHCTRRVASLRQGSPVMLLRGWVKCSACSSTPCGRKTCSLFPLEEMASQLFAASPSCWAGTEQGNGVIAGCSHLLVSRSCCGAGELLTCTLTATCAGSWCCSAVFCWVFFFLKAYCQVPSWTQIAFTWVSRP